MTDLIIKPKNSLLRDKRFGDIKDIILKRLQEFQNIDKYKFNNEFLSLACTLIEHLVLKEDNVKITLTLSKKSVDFFKHEAKKLDTPYQLMIRSLLDKYAESFG